MIFRSYDMGMMERPKKPPDEVRENVLRIRLTAAERTVLDTAALSHDEETSSWARSILLGAAKKATIAVEPDGGGKETRAKQKRQG